MAVEELVGEADASESRLDGHVCRGCQKLKGLNNGEQAIGKYLALLSLLSRIRARDFPPVQVLSQLFNLRFGEAELTPHRL